MKNLSISELHTLEKQPLSYEDIALLNFISQIGKGYLETLSLAFAYGRVIGKEASANE